MAKYRKLSYAIYHCNYHVIFIPKYRYRILEGKVKEIVDRKSGKFVDGTKLRLKRNIQRDHVRMLISVSPKLSVSEVIGIVKGKSAIHLFKTKRRLKEKPFWGNHFCACGYFSVDNTEHASLETPDIQLQFQRKGEEE